MYQWLPFRYAARAQISPPLRLSEGGKVGWASSYPNSIINAVKSESEFLNILQTRNVLL